MGNAGDTLINLQTAGNFKALLWFVSAYRMGWNINSEVDRGWNNVAWGLWKRLREGDNPWHGLWDGTTYQDAETGAFGHWSQCLLPEFGDPANMPYLMHLTVGRGGIPVTAFELRDKLQTDLPPCMWCGGPQQACPCHPALCVACTNLPCRCSADASVLDQYIERSAGDGDWIELKTALRVYASDLWCTTCGLAASWIRRPTQRRLLIADIVGVR